MKLRSKEWLPASRIGQPKTCPMMKPKFLTWCPNWTRRIEIALSSKRSQNLQSSNLQRKQRQKREHKCSQRFARKEEARKKEEEEEKQRIEEERQKERAKIEKAALEASERERAKPSAAASSGSGTRKPSTTPKALKDFLTQAMQDDGITLNREPGSYGYRATYSRSAPGLQKNFQRKWGTSANPREEDALLTVLGFIYARWNADHKSRVNLLLGLCGELLFSVMLALHSTRTHPTQSYFQWAFKFNDLEAPRKSNHQNKTWMEEILHCPGW